MFPYLFVGVYLIFPFSIIILIWSLACCLKSIESFPDSYHSFSIFSLCRVAPKITVKCVCIVFPCPFSVQKSLIYVVTQLTVCIPKNRTANIHSMSIRSPMLPIKGAPANYDTLTCWLGPTLRYVLICHFFIMDSIFWLYQTLGLFIICTPDTDVTKYLSSKKTLKWIMEKFLKLKN